MAPEGGGANELGQLGKVSSRRIPEGEFFEMSREWGQVEK